MLPTTEAFLGGSLIIQFVFLGLTIREYLHTNDKRGMAILAAIELCCILMTMIVIGMELDRPVPEPIPLGDSYVRTK